MKDFKKHALATAVALSLCSAGAAQAGTVLSQMFAGFQQFSDNSAEYLINAPGTGVNTVDVGDRLHGIFSYATIEKAPSTHNIGGGSGNNELTGVFDITVASKTSAGTGWFYTFTPTASFATDYGLAAGAMVAYFEDAANNFSRVGGPPATVASLEATATDGSLFWVSGFNAGDPNYWAALANSDDITAIGSTPAPGVGGNYNAGLTLLTNNSGSLFNKVSCYNGVANVLVDQCMSGSLLGTSGVTTPFQSFDNIDMTMNRVPEPATLALLGLGLLGLAALRHRNS